ARWFLKERRAGFLFPEAVSEPLSTSASHWKTERLLASARARAVACAGGDSPSPTCSFVILIPERRVGRAARENDHDITESSRVLRGGGQGHVDCQRRRRAGGRPGAGHCLGWRGAEGADLRQDRTAGLSDAGDDAGQAAADPGQTPPRRD